ncbi:uncharacterized protein FN964_009209 isoform 1-T9 [Alca torda]
MGCSSHWAPQPAHPPLAAQPPITARGPARPGPGSPPGSLPPSARSPERGGWAVPAPGPGALVRASHGQRWPGAAAEAAGGTAGPPRWFCPLEGKRAPHKRGGAAAPAPQPSAPASHRPLPAPLLPPGGSSAAAPGNRPGWLQRAASRGPATRAPGQEPPPRCLLEVATASRPEAFAWAPGGAGVNVLGGHRAVDGEVITSTEKVSESFGRSRNWAWSRHGAVMDHFLHWGGGTPGCYACHSARRVVRHEHSFCHAGHLLPAPREVMRS